MEETLKITTDLGTLYMQVDELMRALNDAYEDHLSATEVHNLRERIKTIVGTKSIFDSLNATKQATPNCIEFWRDHPHGESVTSILESIRATLDEIIPLKRIHTGAIQATVNSIKKRLRFFLRDEFVEKPGIGSGPQVPPDEYEALAETYRGGMEALRTQDLRKNAVFNARKVGRGRRHS